MISTARYARLDSLLNSPLPQALLVAAVILVRLTGTGPLIDPLRLAYGCGVTLVFTAMYLAGLRRDTRFPAWATLILFSYVAFELLVTVTPLYYSIPLLDRFEHFAAFAVLTLLLLLFATLALRGAPSNAGLLTVGALSWAVGWGNELIEFYLYGRMVFFTRDTVLDLVMNTLAIAVLLLAARLGFRPGKNRPAGLPQY